MTNHKYTNNLINETSPYLLQHAHNPVNWYAWGAEALKKSKEEDKPILVSIGYSACHWCHVMEHESFEDEATAQLMNEYFINIKIDREERPDLDHIYMDAMQAITGSGGWPLNVFLTPDRKPFFGGTYFPPVRAFNRSSWKEVLVAVAKAYNERRDEIVAQADTLMRHLLNANNFSGDDEGSLNNQIINGIAETLLKHVDEEWGGFGQAPKFPQTFSIIYLLRHYYLTGNELSKKTALLSLDKMMDGGIYDHLGGGFSRYATDRQWQIPHFEKMLYDNALLINALAEAYQLTKNEKLADVIKQTIEFIKREMTSTEGGFYSALDADSEGIEGKYYTWSKNEVDDLLGDHSSLFCRCYNILERGNWEHTNILWVPESFEKISAEIGISKGELVEKLNGLKQKLFNARQLRTRPGLDNKVLTGWNALMVLSLCKAYDALGNNEYLELAKRNITFLEKYLFGKKGNLLLHSWNNIANQQQAFLDDHATLILAYIFLHQSIGDAAYLLKARALLEQVLEIFSDEQQIYFYYTASNQVDIPIRKIEMYDGATPSGNSLMATNLILLSVYFDTSSWRKRAEQMIFNSRKLVERYPTSFGVWGLNLQLLVYGLKEIVIVGEDYRRVLSQVLGEYIPLKVIQASATENPDWPLVREKLITQNQTNIYICENYKCLKPFTNFIELKNYLPEHF
jgi:uncharacterized protein YyaL (SSP411 family)